MISPEYLPNVALRELSRMRKDEYDSLLTHWRQRQEKSTVVFRFSSYVGGDDKLYPAKYDLRDRRSNVNGTSGAPSGAGNKEKSSAKKGKTDRTKSKGKQPARQLQSKSNPRRRVGRAESDDEDESDEESFKGDEGGDSSSSSEDFGSELGKIGSDSEGEGEEGEDDEDDENNKILAPSWAKKDLSRRATYLNLLSQEPPYLQILSYYNRLEVSQDSK